MYCSIPQGIVAVLLIYQWVSEKRRAKRFEVAMGAYKHQILLAVMVIGCVLTAAGTVWFSHKSSQSTVAGSGPTQEPKPTVPSSWPSQASVQPAPEQRPVPQAAKKQEPQTTFPKHPSTAPAGRSTNQPTSGHTAPPSKSSPSISIGGGNTGNVAGVNNGQQVFNQYGALPPKVTWAQHESVEPWIALGSTTVTLKVDRMPGTLAFKAICKGQCDSAGAFRIVRATLSLSESISYTSTNKSIARVVMIPHQPLLAGEEIEWVFRTNPDGSRAQILDVSVIPEDDISKLPQLPPGESESTEFERGFNVPAGIKLVP